MSTPWLRSSKSRSRSQSPSSKKPKVDQFGRTLPSKSRSRSRSRDRSRGRSMRERDPDSRHSRDSSRGHGRGDAYRRPPRERDEDRSRGRRTSRDRKRPKRDGSSSSSSSNSSSGAGHERLVASNKPKYLNCRLFVANLISKEVTKGELIELFEKYGNVVDVLVHPKNYAFIQYLKEDHAKLAIEGEHGSTFKGWRLDVKMANENRKDGGGDVGRGGYGFRGGRGRGRGGYGGMDRDRDRSPLHDDPYGDPYRGGPGGRGLPPPHGPYPPPPGDFGLRDPYYPPDPYRRGPYPPDPWLDDPYRRDPYADPYRDPYRAPAPLPPPVIECEIFIVNAQLRAYGDAVEHRVKEHNIITAVSIIPEGRTAPQMLEELTARDGLFAIFINPQNETHRSVTLNILHGTPQEHRNMPLDDAIALVGRSFVKYVDGLREKAKAAATPLPSSSAAATSTGGASRVFLPASAEVSYLLNLLADNRALTVAELNSVIKYLQDRRDKLIDAESRPIVTDDGYIKSPPQRPDPTVQSPSVDRAKDVLQTQQELTNKILSIFSSAGGSIQGVPPASNGKQPVGTPAPPPPPAPATAASSASLINFDNPNVQKALDNLIQSSPSLLKNFSNTTMSSAQMGTSSQTSSMGGNPYGMAGMQGGYGNMQQAGQSQQRPAPPPPPSQPGGYNPQGGYGQSQY